MKLGFTTKQKEFNSITAWKKNDDIWCHMEDWSR